MRSRATHLEFAADDMRVLAALVAGRCVATLRDEGGALPAPGGSEADRAENERLQWSLRDDGRLLLRARRAINLEVTTRVSAGFKKRGVKHEVALDAEGGVGFWGDAGTRRRPLGTARTRWSLAPGAELWIMAMPARIPDPRRARDRIAHEGQPTPYPEATYLDDARIAEIGRHAEVFAWHAYFWRALPRRDRPRLSRYAGRRCSWMSRHHEPEDPAEMDRVLRAVRQAGMRPVAYLSPRHARAPDVVNEMRRIVNDYGFDGLYLDGLARDFTEADLLVRAARAVLGPDRLLYLNLGEGPFADGGLPAPFLEAPADYVLRGSNGRGGLSLPEFFRWVLAGDLTGGARGFWCPYGSRGLWRRDRAPSPREVQVAAKHGVRIWRRSHWGQRPEELRAFDEAVAREKVAQGRDLADKP